MTAARNKVPDLPPVYRPAEAAKVLRCTEWWLKEQARKGRVPYAWIGGSYAFTADHLTEIIQLFEQRPVNVSEPVARAATTRPRRVPRVVKTTARLEARTPRRTRRSQGQPDAV